MFTAFLELVIGVPVLLVFAGLVRFDALPDWLVAQRVAGKKWPYFLISYVAFVAVIPLIYLGGEFVRANALGSDYLVLLVACPVAFGLKFILLRVFRIQYRPHA